MPRGGKRTPKAGKKLGRPKETRPVDGNIARKIKARVKAEELWVFLISKAAQKAKETGNTGDLRQALEYLDDRDLGRCVQFLQQAHEFDPKSELKVTVEHIGLGGLGHKAPAKTK